MVLDKLANTFVVKTRDVVRDDYLRDYRSRIPNADTSQDSQLWVEACSFADSMAPLYFDATQVANATSRSSSIGQALDDDGADLGVPRGGAGKASGYVTVAVATGGASINAGTELKRVSTGQRFQTLISGTYNDGNLVAIQSLDTGPTTNLDAGTILAFTNPPAGVGSNATVFANTDGSGLSGGSDAEQDDAYRQRQNDHVAEPPAAGNEADIIKALETIPGLAIQKGFCFPAILGPGTMGIAFTIKPQAPGGSRIPNGAQLAQAAAALQAQFASDDGIVVAGGADDLTQVHVRVTWLPGTPTWTDAAPWPAYYSSDPVHVTAGNASSATVTSSAVISDPQPNQTIGFYDSVTRTFKRKRIATVGVVVATHTYNLTFDMSTLGASDPTFAPVSGALAVPWSDSLDSTVDPILAYMDKQGPGEMVATFLDPGLRQRRFPAPAPDSWPSVISNRLVDGLFAVCFDAVLVAPTVPKITTVGTPGALFYVHRVSTLGVYPQ